MLTSAAAPISLAASHVLAAGSSGPSPLWYTTRAPGVAGTARVETRAMPRIVRSSLHRNVGLLAAAFVAVHVLTSVLDPYAGIGFISAVIPFSSAYRTLW